MAHTRVALRSRQGVIIILGSPPACPLLGFSGAAPSVNPSSGGQIESWEPECRGEFRALCRVSKSAPRGLQRPGLGVLTCRDEARWDYRASGRRAPLRGPESCLQTTRQAAEDARYVYASSLTPITVRERVARGNPHAYPAVLDASERGASDSRVDHNWII